ncbi:unnamed protein product [Sphagnum troendelagicum]|uniref:NADPH:adrenodoxin oxidoreductase, mitochondrial n=1 Tax=Sphagnum troendelagicum TaxID=128251 RepID=A0ABP0TXQ4_9BRYO
MRKMAWKPWRHIFWCDGGVNVGRRLITGAAAATTPDAAASLLRVCVVGSGPAGFYTAEKVLRRFAKAKVDILERLPTPFGLVRSGVAPDHPETKVVTNQFSRVAVSGRCSFFGNVRLGMDVSLDELRKLYHVVVLAYGAESDRSLKIPGEDLAGVHSAREFVWWYNGHPDAANLQVDLKSTDTVVILGQGNVALDAARILLRPTSELASTDIAEHALAALHESCIRRVFLVGRRGPVQAACTAKEVREILGVQGLGVRVHPQDLITSPQDLEEMKKSRSHKRVYELFSKAARAEPMTSFETGGRELSFVFFRNPTAFLPSQDGSRVAGVHLEKTILQGKQGSVQRALGTGQFEDLPCGMVLKSIGYKSLSVPGLSFDDYQGRVPNAKGRVLRSGQGTEGTTIENGLYVVGWLKRGPSGIIGTNLVDAEETIDSIAEDESGGLLTNSAAPSQTSVGSDGLETLLKSRGIPSVSFGEWLKVDATEVALGNQRGKPREKIISKDDMLNIAKHVNSSSQTEGIQE